VFHFPGFGAEVTEWLLERRSVAGIAVDTLSLDYGPSKDFQIHRLWLPSGRWGSRTLPISIRCRLRVPRWWWGRQSEGRDRRPARLIALV